MIVQLNLGKDKSYLLDMETGGGQIVENPGCSTIHGISFDHLFLDPDLIKTIQQDLSSIQNNTKAKKKIELEQLHEEFATLVHKYLKSRQAEVFAKVSLSASDALIDECSKIHKAKESTNSHLKHKIEKGLRKLKEDCLFSIALLKKSGASEEIVSLAEREFKKKEKILEETLKKLS